ncbi:phosphopantetheine-binding protein [Denitromonas sp.]|uniref:phosphopantetheine-binding protein n=1 Tax=Denitromonas sp. TaxID=2734609 RepID=UPI002AFF4553|nr:phosphopantetheine-binding protein [Denitromonas sp.]
MDNLQTEIRQLIIDALDLEDMTAEDIDPAAPLFGDGLGLDSIDALELGVALRKRYQVRLDGDDPSVKRHFHSVNTLVELVRQHSENKA